jgi:hypothetical protein
MKKIFLILVAIVFSTSVIIGQNLKGTWEGNIGGREFLQMNIIQVGEELCGYTWDYELYNRRSYCKANFTGFFSKNKNSWYITGNSFMENSGSHGLMQLKFVIQQQNGVDVMKGFSRFKSNFSLFGDEAFTLRRVSFEPTKMTDQMIACSPTQQPENKKTDTVIIKKIDTLPKNQAIKSKTDSVKIIPIIVKKDTAKNLTAQLKTNGRINKEQNRIILNDKKIKLEIYDNGTIDGDIISVFFDDKKVVDSKKLSAEPIVINLELDETKNVHTLVLFAENLGSIPPNTALIIATTSKGKRYELYSSATLNQNAALIFEYKP